jgi:hypothetical protein
VVIVAALMANALVGMWWLGLLVLAAWFAYVGVLAVAIRHRPATAEKWLASLSRGFGAQSGAWRERK